MGPYFALLAGHQSAAYGRKQPFNRLDRDFTPGRLLATQSGHSGHEIRPLLTFNKHVFVLAIARDQRTLAVALSGDKLKSLKRGRDRYEAGAAIFVFM